MTGIPSVDQTTSGLATGAAMAGAGRGKCGTAIGQRIVLTLHRAFEMRAAFDGDGLVDDVALDPRGRGQADLQPTHAADDTAVHHDVVGHDLAPDGGAFADGQQMGADVALDRAFDLDVAGGAAGCPMIVRSDDSTEAAGLALGAVGVKSMLLGLVIEGLRGGRLVGVCLGTGFVDLAFRKHLSLP